MGTQNRAYRRAPVGSRDGARPRKERSKNRESRETARKKRALADKAVCKLLGEHEWEELPANKVEVKENSLNVKIEVCKRCGHLKVDAGWSFTIRADDVNWTTSTVTYTDDNTTDASSYTNITDTDITTWSTK